MGLDFWSFSECIKGSLCRVCCITRKKAILDRELTGGRCNTESDAESLGVFLDGHDPGCDAHGHQFLEEQLAGIGDLDHGNLQEVTVINCLNTV